MDNHRRRLHIEWRHLELEGATCDRCSATGQALREAVERLKRDLSTSDVEITLEEVILTQAEIPQSNAVFLNGVALETLLAGASTTMTDCASCGCLTGQDTQCRAVVLDGVTHEDIPPDLIHAAALAALKRQPCRPDDMLRQGPMSSPHINSHPED